MNERPKSLSRCQDCCSRRRFLEASLKAASAIAIAPPALSLLQGCSQQSLSNAAPPGPAVTVPTSSNNEYTFGFADYPALSNAGGSVTATIQAASGTKTVFITRVDANTVDTVSTICTHAGCTLNPYDPSTQQYYCACHGSIFSPNGSVINGPAVTPLPSYQSALTATGVVVTVP